MKIRYCFCCDKCFEEIAKIYAPSARIWMDLCALSVKRGHIMQLSIPDSDPLRILENLGFLVSTEQEETITIKMNGRFEVQQTPNFLFCIQHDKHE